MNKNKFIKLALFILIIWSVSPIISQDKRERIGTDDLAKTGTNYYNYSDLDKVNFEISLWGYVRSPGKYLIPEGTTFIDLISLSGGPLVDAKLEAVRIIRLKNDTLNIKEDKVITLNYKDFLTEEGRINPRKQNPVLLPGDVILIPGGKEYTFRDYLPLILASLSAISSIAVLMVTIFKK